MQKNRQSKPQLSFRNKFALIISGLFLFFMLLEASLRLGGFILLSIQECRNLQSIKQKGAYRILCLGESTTQGEYPPFLEQALNQHNIGIRFSVIDKGRSGTRSSMILNQVESYLVEYHPDMVVAMMGINDGGEYIPYEAPTTSKSILLIRSLRTYKLTRFLWLRILTQAREMGLHQFNEQKQGFGKAQRYIPENELKDDLTGSILTEELLKKAIGLNPKNDSAYTDLGHLYRNQGKYPQAEELLKKAMELNPQNDNNCVELGWLYKVQGKYPQAEELLKKAIGLNPKNDSAYTDLGHLYRNQGKYPQAEELLKKAMELNPQNDNNCVELGWLYKVQGKYPQAEGSFKKALELNFKNDNTHVELGRLYRNQGKYPQAKDALKKAIELNPKNDTTYGIIAGLCKEAGKLKLAKEYTEKADRLRLEYYQTATVNSYRKLKEILDQRKIRLVCVQYPMRSIDPLKKIFRDNPEGIIFVDNQNAFKEAVKRASYGEYFVDMFAGDFGHCTVKGNKLLAQQIADAILREVLNK